MTAKFKKIFMLVSLSAVILLSSLFFVGCGESAASKIELTADKSEVTLYVGGQTEDVTFTIQNYVKSISPVLSYSLVDVTASSDESEHARLEQISQNGNVSVVRLTGVSGGQTQLIARTSEGNKQEVVTINVKQFSTTFTKQDDAVMYVSYNSPFEPTSDYFNFDLTATERELSFYNTSDEDEISPENEFSSVRFEGVENEQGETEKRLVFYDDAGHVVDSKVPSGDVVNFVAHYVNEQTGEEQNVVSCFYVVSGFDTQEAAVNVSDTNQEPAQPFNPPTNSGNTFTFDALEIVSNKVGEGNSLPTQKFAVELKSQFAVSNVFVDITPENNRTLTITKRSENNRWNITVSSAVNVSQSTFIKVDVYYKIGQISFASINDASVHQTIIIPIEIKLIPEKILVNEFDEGEKQYTFYDQYVGNVGWQRFDISVSRTDSTFNFVKMQYNSDQLAVRYKGSSISGGELDIDDLSEPVYIRGNAVISEGQSLEGKVTFTVDSELLSDENPVKYDLSYSILKGARNDAIEFDNNTTYDYEATNPNSGIFVSLSQSEATFKGLKVESGEFDFATVDYYDQDAGCVDVSYVGKENNIIVLSIKPIKVGTSRFVVMLDNGANKIIAVRVIGTLESATVDLDSSATNENVVSAENDFVGDLTLPDNSTTITPNMAMNIVVKNEQTSQQQYGRSAFIKIDANDMSCVQSIRILKNPNYVEIYQQTSSQTKGRYEIKTLTSGDGDNLNNYIIFEVSGSGIENFAPTTNRKYIVVKLTSFVPVSNFDMYVVDKEEETLANNVSLYVGLDITDPVLQSVAISPSVLPSNAYGFKQYNNDNMGFVNANYDYKADYIYYTVNGNFRAYVAGNATMSVPIMTSGETYWIAANGVVNDQNEQSGSDLARNYLLSLDLTNPNRIQISVNNSAIYSESAITLFAGLRQYDTTRYFPITVEFVQYESVTSIKTEGVPTTLGDNSHIELTNQNDGIFSFDVYVNPSSATDTSIYVGYKSENYCEGGEPGKAALISPDGISIIGSNGVYLVTIRLSEEAKNEIPRYPSTTYQGTLEIIPNAWLSNGVLITGRGYENLYPKISISFANGSEANPYAIDTLDELTSISSSSHYKLYGTIDLSGTRLPLLNGNAFSGSIVGVNGASLTGLQISRSGQGGNFGLFGSLSGKISNISISGSFSGRFRSGANIGLLCGTLDGGKISNVSAQVLGGTISLANSSGISLTAATMGDENLARKGTSIGGLTGRSWGTIEKVNVVFEDYLTIHNSDIENKDNIYVGGIVGVNTGTISGFNSEDDRFGYEAYLSYALLDVRSDGDSVDDESLQGELVGYAGSIAGVSTQSSKISNVLVGGEIFAKWAGGLVGEGNGAIFGSITTRTFVRGGSETDGGIGLLSAVGAPSFSTSASDITNILVQATNNDERLSFFASMGILLRPDIDDLTDSLNTENKINKFMLVGSSTSDPTSLPNVNITFETYITKDYYQTDSSDELIFDTAKNYYGDYIILNNLSSRVLFQRQFTQNEVQKANGIGWNTGFVPFSLNDEKSNVSYAYYFEAEAIETENGWDYSASTRLRDAQDFLDQNFNTVAIGSDLYPFNIDTKTFKDLKITSKSPNVEIKTNGTMIFKGTGLAKIEISSILNESQKIEFYLDVINFFNVGSYLRDQNPESGMFSLDSLPLGNGSQFNVFSAASVDVSLSPTYSFVLENNINNAVIPISESGVVNRTAGPSIKLKANKSLQTVVSKGEGDTLTYGYYTITRDGVTFSKKGHNTSDELEMVDEGVSLQSILVCQIDGKEYKLLVNQVQNISINYFEGAQSIVSLYENYVISSSSISNDEFSIVSDYKKDRINWVIEDDFGTVVASGKWKADNGGNYSYEQGENNLFSIVFSGETENQVKLTVNKNSTLFKNRLNENIYKIYSLRLSAISNSNVLKTLEIELIKEELNNISVVNYPSSSSVVENGETLTIMPGVAGFLSVTLNPLDADFDYVDITNDEQNYLTGASYGLFEIGYIVPAEAGSSTPFTFVSISGAQVLSNGIRISRQAIEQAFGTDDDKISGYYQGQFYVRYMFSNAAVVDGTKVSITITVHSPSANPFAKSFEYTLYRSSSVRISFAGYSGEKKYVARGLEYELEIRANGFENVDVQAITSQPIYQNFVRVEQRDGKWMLVVEDESYTYPSDGQGIGFNLVLKASRHNAFGQLEEESDEIDDINVLEYVIDYDTTFGAENNIIEGMENGVISTAVGEKTELKLDFGGNIEYKRSNAEIAGKVDSFLTSLQTRGTWTLYTDLNANNENGVPTKPVPLDANGIIDHTASVIISSTPLVTRYLRTSGFSIITRQAHSPQNRHYYISFSSSYRISGGEYHFDTNGTYTFSENADIYSFIRSSQESPNPITSYNEFLAMSSSEYYILLNDIHIPAVATAESQAFTPLGTSPRYFDGNNHSFIFDMPDASGRYNLSSASEVGLFQNVGQNSIIKNVTIQIGSDDQGQVDFYSSATDMLSFGFVAGVNNGSITNAKVVHQWQGVSHLLFEVSPTTGGFYFGGLVGSNAGNLTNSISSVKIQSEISLGGLVGSNAGRIASSAFKEGILSCVSQQSTVFGVGGLAASNSETASIITSFTSGVVSGSRIYSSEDDGSYATATTVPVGGFIYINEGLIQDCYSSLPLNTSSGAGFAFVNDGTIDRCFSTSVILPDNRQTSYWFAGKESEGSFKDCYYLSDTNLNESFYTGSAFPGENPIALTQAQFSTSDPNFSTNFASYAYKEYATYSAVWFFSNGKPSNTMFKNMQFAGGRLELVSANMIAQSEKIKIGETIREDGTPMYEYIPAADNMADGSATNPYIIYDPETFESYAAGNTKNSKKFYRLINNIDYSSVRADFNTLYKRELGGTLEGNGMRISGISLSSSEQLTQAGLFGGVIGVGSNAESAAIMNLTLIPSEVVFTNANIVGALAGRIQNANIYNVNVYGTNSAEEANDEETILTVTGKNYVGGVFGKVEGSCEIKNVVSLMGAVATHIPIETTDINENENVDSVSFAGGVVGYLGGQAKVKSLQMLAGALNVIGGKAGFAFGATSESASVENLSITMSTRMILKPYRYGGFVVGHLQGSLKNVSVIGKPVDEEEDPPALISIKPSMALAVGGIAGLMQGKASIEGAYMSQGFMIPNEDTATTKVSTIRSVGGLVGEWDGTSNGRISQAIVDAKISARQVLGGAVGTKSGSGTLTLNEIAIHSNSLTVTGQQIGGNNAEESACVGGIVAYQKQGQITITDSYCQANIVMSTYVYSMAQSVFFGGLIGQSGEGNVQITNAYTSSTFVITIEDKSSNKNGERYNGTDVTGVSYAVKVNSHSDTINNAHSVGYDDNNKDKNITESIVSLIYRKHTSAINAHHTNYATNYGETEEALYKCMGDQDPINSKWRLQTDAYPTLVFESRFLAAA